MLAVARVRVARERRRSCIIQPESEAPSSAREGRGALSDRVRPAPRAYLAGVTMDPRSAWAVLHEVALEDGDAQVDRRSNLALAKIRDGRSPARGGGNIDAAGSDRAARASGWREDEATKSPELSVVPSYTYTRG